MGLPLSLFHLFSAFFKQTSTQVLQINVKNVHPVFGAGIRTHNLESPHGIDEFGKALLIKWAVAFIIGYFWYLLTPKKIVNRQMCKTIRLVSDTGIWTDGLLNMSLLQ